MPKLAYRTTLPRPDDPDILEAVYAQVSLGIPLSHAAVNAGVSEWTAWHWDEDGRKAIQAAEDAQDTRELGSVALFAQCVKEAKARSVAEGVREWRAAGKDWPKWATLLERRFPGDFGRFQRIEVDTTTTQRVVIELSAEAAVALAALSPALRQALLPETVEGEVMTTLPEATEQT